MTNDCDRLHQATAKKLGESHMTFKHVRGVSLRRSLACVAGASVLALTLAQGAVAQDSDDEGDVVIATGIRQALENALVEKRNSASLTEVILAEDIGKLPDQNLAEVLENITGVQITRTAGVGTGVQIRGTSDNRTEINGVSTIGGGTGRVGIAFEDLSASIIAGVEVIKAPEAKTIEGSVGGTINLRTIRPLDLNDPLASVRIQGENSSLANDGFSPRFSGALGNKWEGASGQEIGFVLSGSYTEQEAVSFRPRVDRDNFVLSDSGVPAAQSFDFLPIQFLNQELENFEFDTINVAGTVEAKPTNNLKLFLDVLYTDQERRQDSHRIQGSGVSSVRNVNVPAQFETIDFGSLDGVDLGSIEAALVGVIEPDLATDDDDPNLRFSSDTGARLTESSVVRLGGEWEKDALSARVEFANSTSDTENPNLSTTLNFINPNCPLDGSSNDNCVPFAFDLSDGLTFGINFDSPFAPTIDQLLDPNNVVLDAVTVGADTTENSETSFRVDLGYDFDTNFLDSIDVGYRYNDTTSEFNDIMSNFGTGAIANSPNGALFADLLVQGPDNFDEADGRALAFRNFLLVDPNAAFEDPAGTLATLQAALDSTPGGQEAIANGGRLLSGPSASTTAFFDITEETHALYGQANFDFGIIKGNAGLRYLDTSIESLGNTDTGGVITQEVTEASYTEWLPRVNLAAEVTDDILLRASWSEDILRPSFNLLNTSISFPTGPNNAVSIGNPELGPESVTSFDASIDWYFAPSALLTVGFFHKDRSDLFVTQTEDAFEDPVTGFRDITDPCEQGGIFNPLPDRNVLSDTIGNGLCVPIQTTINDTDNTTQTGVEVGFQYDLSSWEDRIGFASGFGLLANYTYQDFGGGEETNSASGRGSTIFEASSGQTDVVAVQGLLDNSPHAYNVTLFYEKYGLSARARYTWRDDFRTNDTAAGASQNSTFGFPVVTASRGQLNASINYDVTDSFNIGVEAVNLTESNIEQFCVNDGALLCFEGLPDRRIVIGGSYTF